MLVTSNAGVEAIPILKSWAVIPCSVLFFFVYSKLCLLFSKKTVFFIVVYGFVFFYVIFALIIYPFKHIISPRDFSKKLMDNSSKSFHPFFYLLEEWVLGLFYVVSELWASAVCQFLFWQVANDIMSIKRAKSIYPLIGAAGKI